MRNDFRINIVGQINEAATRTNVQAGMDKISKSMKIDLSTASFEQIKSAVEATGVSFKDFNAVSAQTTSIFNENQEVIGANVKFLDANNNAMTTQLKLNKDLGGLELTRNKLNQKAFSEEQRLAMERIKNAKLEKQEAQERARQQRENLKLHKQKQAQINNLTRDLKSGFIYEMGIAIQRTITWTIAVGGLYNLIRKFKGSVEFIKDMDEQLTTIAMVTGQTRENVQGLASDYNDLGRELKAGTVMLAESAVALYRQGLNAQEVEERLRQITMAAKVAGISIQDATTYATVGINAMKRSAEDFNDTLIHVASKSATDYEKLAVAFQKSAASFNNANVELEKATSYMATVLEVSQLAPETVGTAFKTIMARFSNVTEEGLQNAEDMNAIVKALSDVAGITAVADGQLRDLGEILDELGAKWDTLDKSDQNRLRTVIAGVRQGDILLTLLDNYGRSLELYDDALQSHGATLRQYEVWQTSLAASQEELNNAWERFYLGFIEGGQVQSVYNALTKMVDGLTSFSQNVDLLSAGLTTMAIVITGMVVKSLVKLKLAMMAAEITATKLILTMSGLPFGLLAITMGLVVGYFIKLTREAKDYKDAIREATEESKSFRDTLENYDAEPTAENLDRLTESVNNLRNAISQADVEARLLSVEQRLRKMSDRTDDRARLTRAKLQEERDNLLAILDELKKAEDAIKMRTARMWSAANDMWLPPNYTKPTPSDDDFRSSVADAVPELDRFYHIIRRIAESKYLMDMADGVESQSEAIQNHIKLLKEYNVGMQQRVNYLNTTIDLTNGLTKAEYDNLMERDKLTDTIRSNNLEIERLISQYKEINKLNLVELDKFYQITRDLAMAEFNHRIAVGVEEQSQAIEQQMALLAQYNMQLESEIRALDKLIDVTNGITQAEYEHIQQRDRHIDTLNANRLAILDLVDAYNALFEVEVKQRLDSIRDVEREIIKIIRKREELERKSAKDAHDEKMRLLKEEHDRRLEAYKQDFDAFKDMIDKKKNELREQYAEEDYLEGLKKLRDEEVDIQKQINTLKLRDDIEARKRVLELEEQLADQQRKIFEYQRDHERETLIKNLDNQMEERTDHYNSTIDKEKQVYDEQARNLERAYELLQEHFDRAYSLEAVYSEASKALSTGRIKGINGAMMSLTDAYREFEIAFGEGLSILGETVMQNFIDKIYEAQSAMRDLARLTSMTPVQAPATGTAHQRTATAPSGQTQGVTIVNGRTQEDLPIGTIVHTAGGDYMITGGTAGNYTSIKVPSYDVGTTNVPKDGLAYLHKDEAIIPKDMNPFAQGKKFPMASELMSNMMGILPNVNGGSMGGNNYDIEIKVEGNLERGILPDLRNAIKNVIKETEQEQYRRNKKVGVY